MPLDIDRLPPFAELLRRHRREAHLTQTEVANRIGTYQPNISDWETGATIPSYASLLKLVVLLDLDPVLVGQTIGLRLALDAETVRTNGTADQGEPRSAVSAAASDGGRQQ